MSIQDRRLARAQEILAGAEMKMGVESAHIRALDGQGYLQPGAVYHVGGSMGHLLCALGNVMKADTWVGVVALPEVGWAAAESYGVDVERVVVVPRPWGVEDAVLSALIPAMDVVVCGRMRLRSGQGQRVAAAARQYRTIVLTWNVWPGVSRALDFRAANSQGSVGMMRKAL